MPPNRNRRAEIAKETLEIVKAGSYKTRYGTEVLIRDQVDAAKSSTIVCSSDMIQPLGKARFDSPCCVEVTGETTVAAMQRISQEYSQEHVGCLNFASAKSPGGGFLSGASAQEEALARSSALYPCLQTQFASYYEANRQNKSAFYLDLAILSPFVPFIRDDFAQLLQDPVLCTVITCPAPNVTALQLKYDDPQENNARLQAEIEATLMRRTEIILHCAVVAKVDTLILGAWGCGVFGNSPEMVAQVFQRTIFPKYARHFRRIVFAVYSKDQTNHKAFQAVFTTQLHESGSTHASNTPFASYSSMLESDPLEVRLQIYSFSSSECYHKRGVGRAIGLKGPAK